MVKAPTGEMMADDGGDGDLLEASCCVTEMERLAGAVNFVGPSTRDLTARKS